MRISLIAALICSYSTMFFFLDPCSLSRQSANKRNVPLQDSNGYYTAREVVRPPVGTRVTVLLFQGGSPSTDWAAYLTFKQHHVLCRQACCVCGGGHRMPEPDCPANFCATVSVCLCG
jgi:hypothetical protein